MNVFAKNASFEVKRENFLKPWQARTFRIVLYPINFQQLSFTLPLFSHPNKSRLPPLFFVFKGKTVENPENKNDENGFKNCVDFWIIVNQI